MVPPRSAGLLPWCRVRPFCAAPWCGRDPRAVSSWVATPSVTCRTRAPRATMRRDDSPRLAGGVAARRHGWYIWPGHAAFHEHRPERRGLVLTGAYDRPNFVTLDRLAALKWSGALVVLSACHSGRHHMRYGDELAGLSRTLLAPGATALVSSLRRCPISRQPY
jgi:hypothetical protein